MDLSIETGALTIFWGSCLANLLWVNRDSIYSASKNCIARAANFVLKKSKKIFKRKDLRSSQNIESESCDKMKNQSESLEKYQKNKLEQEIQEAEETQKKEKKKKAKKRRNLRKITKNYEQWFLRRTYLRQLEERKSTNQFSQFLKQIDEWKWREEIVINNRKEIEDIEDFQKYVEEQLDIDEEDEMNCILPYDPFVSELDKES